MPKKPLTISLVIPAYNEESHLADCLRSALAQTVPFTEIIVVDNNSDDKTVAIAHRYKTVRVISEKQQGVVFARNHGFDSARGDIIARIDADTLLPKDWTTQLQAIFSDDTVSAVTGAIHYYDVAASDLIFKTDLLIRTWVAAKMPERGCLVGSNMAIRRKVWQQVRSLTCAHNAVHEDVDLSVHLGDIGAGAIFVPELLAEVSGRRIDADFSGFIHYVWLLPETYAQHGARESRYLYPVAAFTLANYVPLRILFRGYDPSARAFTVQKLFSPRSQPARVNPISLVEK